MTVVDAADDSPLAAYYLREDYLGGVSCAQQAEASVAAWTDQTRIQTFYFYYALLLAALLPNDHDESQQEYYARFMRLPEQFTHLTARPSSSQPCQQLLIAAETARVRHDALKAMQQYEQAIQRAGEGGFLLEEAIANERAGRFYAVRGMSNAARAYVEDAYAAYTRCGARVKADSLARQYSQWFGSLPAVGGSESLSDALIRLTTVSSVWLDVMAIVNASQTLSEETQFAKLIERLMHIVIEHTGATTGMLLTHENGRLLLQAKWETGQPQIAIMQPIPVTMLSIAHSADLPLAILQYVIRTQQPVILNNAAQADLFASDRYIQTHQPQALLCFPLMRQRHLVGLLYLENRLTANVFTPERGALLKVLASQTAISMEHAALYAQLEQKVAERTAELRAAKERFQALSEATFEGLIIHDNGMILEVNKAMEMLTGYPYAELIHRNLVDVLPGAAPEAIARGLSVGDAGPVEMQAFKRDGATFPVEARAQQICWQGRQVELVALHDITWRRRLEDENQALRITLDERDRLGELVGRHPLMRKVYDRLLMAATAADPVIIYGETGTGKELAARTLFALSSHHAKIFVDVNCGAIQEGLFESQFFGYRKGAFTGAVHDTSGFFEQAQGGTLFLDEVAELPMFMQVKLLRVMNDQSYTPVGATVSRKTDIRIVAATNQNLRKLTSAGKFREDLFHRLHVLPIELPPLRLHKEDIPLLIAYFGEQHAPTRTPLRLPPAILEQFMAYEWPGNVRELFNELRRYVTLGETELSQRASERQIRQDEPGFCPDENLPLGQALDAFERYYLARLLRQHRGQRGKIAQALGIDPKTLYNKLKKHGL